MNQNVEEEDEPVEALYFNRYQLEALVIGIPEVLAGLNHRIKTYSDKDAVKNFMQEYPEITLEVATKHVEENLALAESLLEEYPEIYNEIKEALVLISKKEEIKSTIITDVSWPPKLTQ